MRMASSSSSNLQQQPASRWPSPFTIPIAGSATRRDGTQSAGKNSEFAISTETVSGMVPKNLKTSASFASRASGSTRNVSSRNLRPNLFILFFKCAIPGIFFFIFVFSILLTVNVQCKIFPMTGFESRTTQPTESQPLTRAFLLFSLF